MSGRSIAPQLAWTSMQRGEARLLDLRTEVERRRYGAPPGAIPVSLGRHVLKPEGEGTIYLCCRFFYLACVYAVACTCTRWMRLSSAMLKSRM